MFLSLIVSRFIFYLDSISINLIIIMISYFGVTIVFRPKRRAPDIVGGVLLVIFGYIVLTKILIFII
jgi:hypothetical protein